MAIRTKDSTDLINRAFGQNFKNQLSERSPCLPAIPDRAIESLMQKLMPDELKALQFIAENGDLVIVGDQTWLLTPAPASLIDALSALGACEADLEHEPDAEDEHDDDGYEESDYGGASVSMWAGIKDEEPIHAR